MFNFDFGNFDISNFVVPQLDYEALAALAVQAAVASPAVVKTPENVAPSAAAVEKVVTNVIKAVAPDDGDGRLRQLARQVTQAVVTNPDVIAAPAGQTVNTTTIQGIIEASAQPVAGVKVATTPSPVVDEQTKAAAMRAAAPAVTAVTPTATPTAAALTKPDPTKTAYADLTPAQRAAMTQKEKTDYLAAAREFEMAADATARAATDPMKNFDVRPTAPAAAPGMINYYSWVGGKNSGEWKLYQAPDTAENRQKYGSGVSTTQTTTTPTTTTPTTTTPTTTTPTTVTPVTPTPVPANITDPATLALIQSLQSQLTTLTQAQRTAADTTAQAATLAAAEKAKAAEQNRQSIVAVLTDRFQKYGLGSLINKIKDLAIDGATESTITLALQESEEYKTRFKANQVRIAKGLAVLTPAEYLNNEDGYRQVLRSYGLKQFDTDDYVSQFIANDMSPTEFSNRVVTAVQRVQNADPAIVQQLRQYYGVGQQDLVAYVLDPEQQFQKIQRQVAASEIGVAAGRQGLSAGVSVAEQLAAQGVTQAEAQKGYATIADILPTAEKLSDIYGKTLDTYGQSEAEQEVFNSLASAQRKRQRLTAREVAAFSGASGTNKTSLAKSNIGQF
jgi:hypothetical protein